MRPPRARWRTLPMPSSSAAPWCSGWRDRAAKRHRESPAASWPKSAPRSTTLTPALSRARAREQDKERPDELARKTAAAEDPAHRPERTPHGAGGLVDQVPGLRDGALQDRPREEHLR